MSVLIVIPARYASTRYPAKPLAMLKGSTGEQHSLIERAWMAAQQVGSVDRVVIATDDDRIAEPAAAFGAEVVMTPESCANGTERCAAAYDVLGSDAEIVVNLQGDAPLTPPWFVEELIASLRANPEASIATPVLRCDGRALNGFLRDRKAGRVGGTTAVFDARMRALYFSKEVIPFTPQTYSDEHDTPVFHHVGVYAYRPDALRDYPKWAAGPLEGLEGLEQLRFMEQGHHVHCTLVEAKGRQFWELNNPEDVPVIEQMMQEMGIE